LKLLNANISAFTFKEKNIKKWILFLYLCIYSLQISADSAVKRIVFGIWEWWYCSTNLRVGFFNKDISGASTNPCRSSQQAVKIQIRLHKQAELRLCCIAIRLL
jgi:hypothetical protein